MKCVLFLFLFFIFPLFSQIASAYQPKEGNVQATLGPMILKTPFRNSESGSISPVRFGEALIANGDISNHGSLEIAMIHMNKIFLREQGPFVFSEEREMMYITMGYRHWLSEYLSAAMALFSTYAIGSPSTRHNDFPAGQEPTTSASDNTEYGLDMSLQAELWHQDPFTVLVDGRYSLSVTNKSHESGDHYGLIIGVRYFIQDKTGQQKPKD